VKLRDYQQEAIEHIAACLKEGVRRVPLVMATGLGKTVVFTAPALLDTYLNAGQRVLIIAHTDELIEQAAKKARQANPDRRVGIVKAGLNETHAQIIVSSRQTLGHATGGPRRLASLRNVGLIIIDEAHHAVRTNTYGKILEHFGCFSDDDLPHFGDHDNIIPAPPVLGFTATLARGDKAKLSTVWQDTTVYETVKPAGSRFVTRRKRPGPFSRDILFGIRHGYLLDVSGKRVVVPDFDMSRVRQSGGDYRDSDLGEELERTFAPEIIAQAYAESCAEGTEFRKGIAFWPLVETAYHGAKAFNEAGIRSEVIHGELPKLERRAMLKRLHTGETRVIHGVGVLTEGFDEPTCDVVVVARPTRSAPLYQQMVGRVLRPNLELPPAQRGKALILDVVGAGARHDLRSLIDLAPERHLRRDAEELSLLELDEELIGIEEQQAAGAGPGFAEEIYHGPAQVQEFDPLGREKLWARTPDGAWYMKAGTVGFVFLIESLAGDPGTWDVVACSNNATADHRTGQQAWVQATDYAGLPLDEALSYAEDVAIDMGGYGSKSLTSRKSKWRNEEPSEAQKRLAYALGINPAGLTKGELGERVDAVKAVARIDPLVRAVRAAVDAVE